MFVISRSRRGMSLGAAATLTVVMVISPVAVNAQDLVYTAGPPQEVVICAVAAGLGGPGEPLIQAGPISADEAQTVGGFDLRAQANGAIISDVTEPHNEFEVTARGGVGGENFTGGSTRYEASTVLTTGSGSGPYEFGSWTITVLPEPGQTVGTPVRIDISAVVRGYVAADGGDNYAAAAWRVSTEHGDVFDDSISISHEDSGYLRFDDFGTQSFETTLGESFRLEIIYELEAWGTGESSTIGGGDSSAGIHESEVQVSAIIIRADCQGDLNGNGIITLEDLGILLSDFGCTGGNCMGDVDVDGDTDLTDLGILLTNFGQNCP